MKCSILTFLASFILFLPTKPVDANPDPELAQKLKGSPLETEFHELTQGSIARMTGGGLGPDGADPSPVIKQFLEGAGIPFDETKGHKFVFDGFQMIVTHERRSLDLIEKILRKLDADHNRQVSVTFKMLDAPLGLIEEVLSETAKAEDDKKFSSIINRKHAERLIEGLLKDENVELLHAPNLLIMDHQPTSYSSAQEVIYPTDFIPPLENNQSKPSQPIAQFDTVAPDDEQPGFRKVGLTIELTPRVALHETIDLELSPKLTRLIGHEDYGQGTKIPVFWSWHINTIVTLGPDETMISRGASSEEKKEIIVFIEASILK